MTESAPDPSIGVNLPEGNPDPDFLRGRLRAFQEDGFDCVEVCLDTLPLIIGGRVQPEYAGFCRGLLKEFRMRYSAHIGLGVDLRDPGRRELQKAALASSIELCRRLALDPLVLHYEAASRDAETEARFLEAHAEAADLAARHGLTLCIENIEVERFEPLLDFVKQVNRPNFRLAFDTGHAWLASRYFHFDFLQAFDACRPYLGHLHLSDNVGIFEELRVLDRPAYDRLPMRYRYTFGRGDLHLPPFRGAIPFGELFRRLDGYRGMFVCEYNSGHWLPFNRQVQAEVRAAVREARAGRG
jgi:sugar phosphate isomerase/epimerase